MDILILHRVPYPKIEYARGIDHARHRVTYLGTRAALATLPVGLPCERVERPGEGAAFDEAAAWLDGVRRPFDRIISLSEYELLDAARLRERYGVPGAPVEQVTLARDKILMKQAVADAGLRAPRFLSLADFLERGGAAPWTGATVLKPHRGASSVDVTVFSSAAEAHEAVAARRTGVGELDAAERTGAVSGFEVEEFVEGPVRHYDGLVEGGKVLALGASEYLGTCLAYAQGLPMGSFQIDCPDEVRDWVTDVLAAVRIEDGSFHLEAIVHDGEPVFLEVGNRVGGADVVAVFELATGIHLPSWELRILLGEQVADALPPPPAERSWYGWFVHPGHHLAGEVFDGFDGAGAYRTAPETVTWHELTPGSPLPGHITYGAHETALAGIAVTASPARTRDWMAGLFRSLRIRTTTGAAGNPKKQQSGVQA
ncbi:MULTISPECIES: acetyl-CoA carboxylase biotin carboxylase subunit family protein [unclassified Streptomyces]|uniref:ATP-grasp domain-containing protein n=1 Tax=unclassified Streptomyces TaxID=2593676 RepID=UPI002255CC15|nr:MULTISPECIES: ATP-grasp domain-containing protein [unclassified Streptomyces]MCX4527046.1 ATP-grasp domain-containing protein [Streptomyces sp. NBC_01551]MCX4542394.1 ATP-grasp domain-containing protein [Streptomyces sp. NBC_01565]